MPKKPINECDTPVIRAEEEPEWALDVVCSMEVDPKTTPHHERYDNRDYYFCCANCLTRFFIDPARYIKPNQ